MSSKQHKVLLLIYQSVPEIQRSFRDIQRLERLICQREHWLYKLLFALNQHRNGYAILGKKGRIIMSDLLSVAFRIHTEKDQYSEQYEPLLAALEEYATTSANIAEEFSRTCYGLDRLQREAGGSGLNYVGIQDSIWDPYRSAITRRSEVQETFHNEMAKWRSLLENS